jgi:hypothetical protein
MRRTSIIHLVLGVPASPTQRFILAAASVAAVLQSAVAASLEDVSVHFSTNVAIVWRAHTDQLPKRFWTYKRLPEVFSAEVISNGIVLAGFEKKGFPRPSTNTMVLWDDHQESEPQPPYFAITPKSGQMSFTMGDRRPDSPKDDMPLDEAAVTRALKCAALLGVRAGELEPKNSAGTGLFGVFLARQIDRVRFLDDTEGFHIRFGKGGRILQFALLWPKLERDESCRTATPEEISRCIRAGKTCLVPAEDGRDYFAQVKQLARARKITITQITARYVEGMIGEALPEQEEPKYVRPVAILAGAAEVGTISVSIRLYAPVISSDVNALLKRR